ncbi:MAG: polysaccharide deacetylase family protein [Oscillospiraceae bacterium]|nr:polysaccharide deacetylase family protein [Oscillospiraceae bacterium]
MKYKIFGKKQITMTVLIIIWAAVLLTVIILTATKTVNAQEEKIPVFSVERSDKKIALTFNAAWGNGTTDEILGILNENDINATFFIVGSFAKSFPESIKKIYNAGHELGNHSLKHLDPVKQEYSDIIADMSACGDIIYSLTGAFPLVYRAPSGSYDNKTVEAAENLGMTAVQWSADSIDWKDPSPEMITDRILKKTAPGGILLFHLDKENTAEALPGIIKLLKSDGYEFVTVSELLLEGDTIVDFKGVQHPIEN